MGLLLVIFDSEFSLFFVFSANVIDRSLVSCRQLDIGSVVFVIKEIVKLFLVNS